MDIQDNSGVWEEEILSTDFLQSISDAVDAKLVPLQIGAIVGLVASTQKLLRRFDSAGMAERSKVFAELMVRQKEIARQAEAMIKERL